MRVCGNQGRSGAQRSDTGTLVHVPMHESESNSTMPSCRRYIAVVGQIGTHGGFAQWLHRVTWKKRRVLGKVPFSTYLTQVRWTPRGTEFSALHAVVQAWQPMHRRLSMTNAKFMRP